MPETALVWRIGIFIGLIVILLLLEIVIPKRKLSEKRSLRWVSNLGIFIVDSVLTRVVVIVGGLAAASYAAKMGWGLLNIISLPGWAVLIITILALDFAVWLQHVMSHRWAWFWRLHRMHHSDLDIDVTTALRFHPLEIFISLIYKSAVIIALGAPLMAVLVTPDMHRVHHSIDKRETNHNYGFCLSWWDRLFRFYTDQPREGHTGMTIGLTEFRQSKDQTFGRLLIQPLSDEASASRPE